jgi:hypothetical protein
MPCCGGKKAGIPISKSRYRFGLLLFLGVHCLILAWMATLSLFVPKYRRLLRPYLAYTQQTVRSVRLRERIRIGVGGEVCELKQSR